MLSREKLEVISRAAEKAYGEFFKNDKSDYLVYTKVKPIKGTSWEEVFITSTGGVKELVGSREVSRPRANKAEGTVKVYTKTEAIEELLVRQDKSNVIAEHMSTFFASQSGYYDKLAFEQLIKGLTQNGYDGVNFFSTAHPNGAAGATQSNRGTTAFSATALDAVCQAMLLFTGEDGEPLGIQPKVLYVGPALRKAALESQKDIRVASVDNSGAESGTRVAAATAPNGNAGLLEVKVDPRIASGQVVGGRTLTGNEWFVFGEKGGAKPIILAEARAPEPKTEPDFANDEIQIALDADLGLGFGMWQLAYVNVL
jgi:phage major head subunit gpT-like protein